MIKISKIFFERRPGMKKVPVMAVEENVSEQEQDFNPEEDGVYAVYFNKQGKKIPPPKWSSQKKSYNRSNFSKPANSSGSYNRPPQQTQTKKPKGPLYCIYCGISGHHQEDCKKRLRENGPCRRQDGSEYRPQGEQAKKRAIGIMEVQQDDQTQNVANSVFQ
jgi:hypothetical protein